jgi:tRNA(fMet)-specific endonuclease VapC
MYLLDTDTLTHLHAGHPNVIAHLQTLDDPVVGTTIITKTELLRGRIDFLLKAATGVEL